MKRKSVTAEEWIRHRKLRKKIASAKWYAHKKEREIEEQNLHRHQLEQQLREQREQTGGFIWPDAQRRDEWYAVVTHLAWGYPARRVASEPAHLWRQWGGRIESDIDRLRETTREAFGDVRDRWLDQTWVLKIIRQMAIRECRAIHQHPTHQGPFDGLIVPWSIHWTHPRATGGLWSTSVWCWLWILTHLGNHREDFPVVWRHLHQHAMAHPRLSTISDLFRSSPTLQHWIRQMSQNIETHLASQTSLSDNPSQSSDSGCGSPEPPAYVTQPPTPEWVHDYDTLTDQDDDPPDSDSESLPSSLDTFLFETFTAVDPQ